MQDFPHGAALVTQVAVAVGWLVGYVGWSRLYYRRVDAALRARVARRVGAPVVWTYRRGDRTGAPLSFRLAISTWAWGLDDIDRSSLRGVARDGVVYALYVVTVPVLAGLLPVALLLVLILAHALHPLIAYPLLFLLIPVYARYWSGRYEVPGMRRVQA
jgi:hypothetical protein